MTSDILDPAALISLLPTLLPSASQTLASQQDAIAALVHTIFSALAFRLVAVDETSTSSLSSNILPEEWSKSGPGNYTFRYKHEQSSLVYLLKVVKLGSRTLVNAIVIESDKVAALDISTNDFTSPSFFPHDCSSGSNAQPLVHGFISSNRVLDLTSQVKIKILQKLLPSLRKEGYTEERSDNAAATSQPQPPHAHPQPQNPFVPRQPANQPRYIIPENPLSIGRSDLDPIPINPFAPPPLFPQSGGDGMFVGPDHPIFGGGRGRSPPGNVGPWGGDGYLPPLGVPPGARFDPIGPRPLAGRYGFNGPPRGRGGPPSGEPDNDEFMPPGMGDMFS